MSKLQQLLIDRTIILTLNFGINMPLKNKSTFTKMYFFILFLLKLFTKIVKNDIIVVQGVKKW